VRAISLVPMTLAVMLGGCEQSGNTQTLEPSVEQQAGPEINAIAAMEGEIPSGTSEASATPPAIVTTSSDERLAKSRELTTDEMLDPKKDFGYTKDDKAFLDEHGVSSDEARAMERVLCAGGIDC
jgi:hypothetical protein